MTTEEKYVKLYTKKTIELIMDIVTCAPSLPPLLSVFHNMYIKSCTLMLQTCEEDNIKVSPALERMLDLMKKMLEVEKELHKEQK